MPIPEMKITLFLGDASDIDLGEPLGANGEPTGIDGDAMISVGPQGQTCITAIFTPNSRNLKFRIQASTTNTGSAVIYCAVDADVTSGINIRTLLIINVDVVQNPAVMFRPKVFGPNRPELLPPPKEVQENP